jgi:hypothetical protein
MFSSLISERRFGLPRAGTADENREQVHKPEWKGENLIAVPPQQDERAAETNSTVCPFDREGDTDGPVAA